VGVGQAVGHLAGDEQRELGREPSALAGEHRQRPSEIAAVDVLEGEEVLVADPADLEHLGDVDVLQLDRDLGLVDEARDELRVLGQARQHLLDHAQLLEAGQAVLGEEDLAHATARQPLDQQVPAEHRGQPDVGQARPGVIHAAFVGGAHDFGFDDHGHGDGGPRAAPLPSMPDQRPPRGLGTTRGCSDRRAGDSVGRCLAPGSRPSPSRWRRAARARSRSC
jgi:hypothetical protein